MRRFLLLAPSATLIVAAQASAQTPIRRDNAGVTTISTGARTKAPVAFELGTTPIVDLGGLNEQNPDLEFKPTQGYLRAVRFSDGGFAVIDEVRVQFFDKAGKREKIVGRSGAGPEEFQYITSICRTRGDTIVVGDNRNRRMTVISRAGQVVRGILQDTLGPPAGASSCFNDGTFVVAKRTPSAPGTPAPYQYIRRRLDGSVVNVVADVVAPPLDMVTMTFVDVSANGAMLYTGTPATGEVGIVDAGGAVQRVIRSADVAEPISEADAEARMRRTIPTNTPPAEVASRMDRMRAMRTATHWPTYSLLIVGENGTMWFRDYEKTPVYPAPAWWTAVEPSGRILGRLMFPAPKQGQRPFEIISFGTNDVLVRRTDEEGAAHLTLYPLVKK